MGCLNVNGPPVIMWLAMWMVFNFVFLVDWIWTGYLYAVHGIALATKRRDNWFESLNRLLSQPGIKLEFEGDLVTGARRGRPTNIIVANGGLANDADQKEVMARVARVWETLPDSVGIVAVVGLVLKASTVEALAKKARFEEYIVVVGPSCVVTSYQVGLIGLRAFCVVNDLTPTRTSVHPSVPKDTASGTFFQLVVRPLITLFAFAIAIYETVSGWVVPAAIAFLTNVVPRVVMYELGLSNNGEGSSWALIVKSEIRALAPYALSGGFYGLSALQDKAVMGEWGKWMAWVWLSLGGLISTMIPSCGAIYSPLTGWMTGLVIPLCMIYWAVLVIVVEALVPLSAIFYSYVAFLFSLREFRLCCVHGYSSRHVGGAIYGFLAGLLFIFPHIILICWALDGVELSSWALYVSLIAGWVAPVLTNFGVEVDLLRQSLRMRGYREAIEKVKDRATAWGQIGQPKMKFGYGFGHKSETGLHVRFVPYYATTDSVSSSDIRVGNWYWRGYKEPERFP